MNYKNPLTVLVVVAAVSAVGGLWSFVHGQSRISNSNAAPSVERPAELRQVKRSNQTIYISGAPGYAAPGTEDAELNDLNETESGLAREADELIAQFASSNDAAEQKKLKTSLREKLARQFDVQKQRRELELGRIEERIKKVREQLKK